MRLGEALIIVGLLACLPAALGYCGYYCNSCSWGVCKSCYSGYYWDSDYGACVYYDVYATGLAWYYTLAIVISVVVFIIIVAICTCIAKRRRMRRGGARV